MIDLATRRKVCEDTISRSVNIAASTPGGSLASSFIPSQLPPLNKQHTGYPNLSLKPIEVHNADSFDLARNLKPSTGKVGVLNLASDQEPGGGWRYTLSATQEEALCYSSTLYATLKPEWYPWPNTGPGSCAGIISPNVVVFKDTLNNNVVELPEEQRHVLAVITVAAPRFPKIAEDGECFADKAELTNLKEKILLTLRVAVTNGVTSLVLGAMGCGAYGCPPRAVAREMRDAIAMEEFTGWFERVVFAVYAAGPSGQRNLNVFQEVFECVQEPTKIGIADAART
ncbi:uncharacterized protein K460DRAFT_360545 [Cucurbitaria berberidis CBS 394.84]|uniref:Microbial-type PARG catalytic domain-containing protein n=1 Tax=Cucurbitaria berberidis CBS 394.84 TaxID=1168544 RepID=A0A9P4LCG8_9PLEO|nr:uncharacterized protein K460DRAFT_360545 [Cucurbitaria berberidis CBS 394.84]KAF1849698.1 hypothetical protein K460DRAFT_360545 [Cucurbitaria berberidis CBS 394.84]